MEKLAEVALKNRGYNFRYAGTWYLARAVELNAALGRPMSLTKELYPALAKQMQTSPAAVERAIRATISRAEPGRTASEVIREVAYGELMVHED